MNKYSQIFKRDMSTRELRKKLYIYAQTIDPEEREELFKAYSIAFKAALSNELAQTNRLID